MVSRSLIGAVLSIAIFSIGCSTSDEGPQSDVLQSSGGQSTGSATDSMSQAGSTSGSGAAAGSSHAGAGGANAIGGGGSIADVSSSGGRMGGAGTPGQAGAPVGQDTGGSSTGTGGGASGVAMAGAGPVGGFANGGTGGEGGGASMGGQSASGASGGGMGGVAGSGGSGGLGTGGSAGSGGADSGAYNPCPMDGSACKILPFGDSITDGFNVPGGYRIELFRQASADAKNFTFVGAEQNGPNNVDGQAFPRAHEGHSGWKIDEIAALVPSPAFNDAPHIVLLMIGTNDVIQNDNLSSAPDRLESLLDGILAARPEALVVVAKLTPLEGQSGTRVAPYNDAIPGVLAAQEADGQHVMLVDMFDGFPLGELADGIHPDEAGYARMAGVWYEAIGELLPAN